MKTSTLFLLLLLLAFLLPVKGKAALYALRSQPEVAGMTADVNVNVYNTHTGQTVWKHHFSGLSKVAWSHDHQKLAFFVGQDTTQKTKIVIWQAGQRQPIVCQKHLSLPKFDFYYDDIFEMKWSPDDKLLAFRTWTGGGDYGQNIGFVWCLEPETGRVRYVASRVGPMQWVNSRRLAFQKFGHYGDFVSWEPGDTAPIRRDDFASHFSYWAWR